MKACKREKPYLSMTVYVRTGRNVTLRHQNEIMNTLTWHQVHPLHWNL